MSKPFHRRRAQRAGGVALSSGFRSEDEIRSAGHRHARLERVVQEELVGLLRDELEDPALAGVAFTSVELSIDYRTARVRFALASDGSGPSPREARAHAARSALERATPFLRARLVDALEIKRVPNLRFVLDPGAAPGLDAAARGGARETGDAGDDEADDINEDVTAEDDPCRA